jgi:nicotinate phosphoribosyltransferase
MKLSAGKTSAPGAKQVYRGPDGDVLALRDEPAPPGHHTPPAAGDARPQAAR